ncbi:MAG: thiamine phosphate synthase [Candidatus Omnitrophota bacterium]|nr:MAG: thiamine phosphate synthase [Candidatus Omnitrophota bacterium]
MNWKKNPASSWKLYCIIDKNIIEGAASPQNVAQALYAKGVDAVQLRYKNYPSYKLVRIAKNIQAIARKSKKALLVNDRIDVALASEAKGVHLGSGDLSFRTAHLLLNPKSIVGKTVHKIKEAKSAHFQKAGYVSAGPVFSTPLKKNLKKQGIGFVKKIKKCVSRQGLPVFAIGGINKRNVKAVLKTGAGICVTRAIFEAEDLLKEIKR